MSGTAQGSANGPKKIFGRENVNWQGPQKAHNGSSTSASIRDDFSTEGYNYQEKQAIAEEFCDSIIDQLDKHSLSERHVTFKRNASVNLDEKIDDPEEITAEYIGSKLEQPDRAFPQYSVVIDYSDYWDDIPEGHKDLYNFSNGKTLQREFEHQKFVISPEYGTIDIPLDTFYEDGVDESFLKTIEDGNFFDGKAAYNDDDLQKTARRSAKRSIKQDIVQDHLVSIAGEDASNYDVSKLTDHVLDEFSKDTPYRKSASFYSNGKGQLDFDYDPALLSEIVRDNYEAYRK